MKKLKMVSNAPTLIKAMGIYLMLICVCILSMKATVFAADAPTDASADGYEIRYILKGGTNHPSNPDRYTPEAGTIILENPSREGYSFDGWYTASSYKNQYRITEITADTQKAQKLYAKWTINKYTVIFDGNGDDGTKSMSSLLKAYNKKFNLTANKFKRAGYKFSGWNTEKDGSGIAYKNKAGVKQLTAEKDGSVTLYAQWTEVKYTIRYKKAVVSLPTDIAKSYTVTTETIALPKLIRSGYTFDGWFTNKNFKAESKIESIPTGSTGNKTLYARWKKGASQETEETKDDPKEETKDDPKEESKDDPKEESKDDPKEESKDDPKDKPENPSGETKKILVAYFSATNNTKGIAEKIADTTGAVLYEIVPAELYTSDDLNYNNSDSRANKEQNNAKARPGISSAKVNMEEYDIVFIGYAGGIIGLN